MAIASLRPNGASDGTSSAGPAPPAPEPVAIIGMACRFPGGAHTPDALWRLLREKGDAVVEVPPDRWSTEFHDPDHTRPGRMVTKHGGFVRQPIDGLDAPFFRISPREAAGIDPMQRWLMEVSWEALEDAGQDVQRLAGAPVGVFIGVFTHDMKILRLSEDNRHLIDAHTAGGVGMTMASNRLSYLFDFRGPSVSLDTACSSSLVAVHLACQSLWSGESELALAGGANAILHPGIMVAESRAGMLSPDGRSKSFDARANGYGRGEGAGVVILKRLSRALTDGDPVRALVLGTAANQDGHTEGITVPNGDAQEALLRAAARQAGISPGRIRYMEAHGTGTPVGDPIEAKALAAVLAEGRPAGDRCIVGSVKANIGHLEAAAGVAGLMKAVLCLEHREIPPQLHFETPNPAIPFDDLCLRIPTTLEPWPDEPGPTLAGVNSFGFGGTNAHAVLASAPDSAEAPAPAPVAEPGATSPGGEDDERAQLIPLSASSPEALAERARQWRRWLEDGGAKVELRDLAYTAAARRTHLPYRVGLVAASAAELAGALDDFGGNGAARRVGVLRDGAAVVGDGTGAARPGAGLPPCDRTLCRPAVRACGVVAPGGDEPGRAELPHGRDADLATGQLRGPGGARGATPLLGNGAGGDRGA
jgi:acyl transferase domain-containing protein